MVSTVTFNGKTYAGKSVSIKGGSIIIDGKTTKCDDKVINIIVEGDIEKLKVDYAEKIAIAGNVESVITDSANVNINGDVNGDVTTEVGNVHCGNVGGKIKTEVGNVTCENVQGSVKTEVGDIKHRK